MKKATRILTTILVLSIVTVLYSFFIAPILEPDSKYQKEDQTRNVPDLSKRQIMSLFQPNDWENFSYRQLNYNNYHFFIGDYKVINSDTIQINKCTVVIANADKPSNAIIIRCLGDITITLEKPVSHGLDDNRILNGTITDEIQVISKGDDETLSVKTRDFSIDRDLISTNANVYFKYGRTQGIGSGMKIQLINQGLLDSQSYNGESGFISQIVENVTLEKLQRLTIVPPTKKESNGQNDKTNLLNAPIELHCDGEFSFNALDKCASFEQNVSLIQMASNKAPNSIRCQFLNLFFSSMTPSDSDRQKNDESSQNDTEASLDEWNLQLVRLEASGPLVVVEAPEYETKIHAGRLTVNLSPLSFELDSANRQCEIHYKNNIVSAQNLIYFVGENGALGTLECNCPGWISSQLEQNGKQIRARWSDRLHLEPDQNDPMESIVSLQGGAWLEMENNKVSEAAISADDIFFWLTKKAKSSQSNGFEEMTLSRMQAKNNVIMKSKPITAKVKTLQLWFDGSDIQEKADVKKAALEAANSPASQLENSEDSSFLISNSQLNNSYAVTGDLLQGKILLGQASFQISELILKDNVRIVQNGDANSKLEMSGSLIQTFNITHPSATASLIGQPAKIRYNNALLTGTAININRGTSRIWIDSGGKAEFSGSAEQGAGDGNSSVMEAKINWTNSMDFQNDTLTFTGSVTLEHGAQFAQCDALSIVLNKKVDFQNLSSEDQKTLDVRFVVLNNSVTLENVTAENGVTVAMDCLTASKMTIDMKKQTFVAEGPGSALTQRKFAGEAQEGDSGNSEQSAENSNTAEANSMPLANSLLPSPHSLMNLNVDFQKRLEGSFDTRSLQTFTFSGYVQTVYYPIDKIGKRIKTTRISDLPPQAFTLKCNQMEIQAELESVKQELAGGSEGSAKQSTGADAESHSNARMRNSSFIASGGVKLEGLNYNADADRITFEGKRGMMTLEGADSKPVKLFYQKVLGGRYNQATSSTIYYNTQTGAVKGEGIQDFSLFLSPKQ